MHAQLVDANLPGAKEFHTPPATHLDMGIAVSVYVIPGQVLHVRLSQSPCDVIVEFPGNGKPDCLSTPIYTLTTGWQYPVLSIRLATKFPPFFWGGEFMAFFNYGMDFFSLIQVYFCLFPPPSISFKCNAWSFA